MLTIIYVVSLLGAIFSVTAVPMHRIGNVPVSKDDSEYDAPPADNVMPSVKYFNEPVSKDDNGAPPADYVRLSVKYFPDPDDDDIPDVYNYKGRSNHKTPKQKLTKNKPKSLGKDNAIDTNLGTSASNRKNSDPEAKISRFLLPLVSPRKDENTVIVTSPRSGSFLQLLSSSRKDSNTGIVTSPRSNDGTNTATTTLGSPRSGFLSPRRKD
ncbi:hypothetical protein NEOLI_005248, partial [Neolecta irregularis DAH-3]